MAKWNDKPIKLLSINENIDYIMCIDENGCSNIENAKKKILIGKNLTNDEKYFTITGCIFTKEEYFESKQKIKVLKEKFWKNGKCYYQDSKIYKAVCFHSREIRHHENCFSSNFINYNEFIESLSIVMKSIECKIISVVLNIEEYINQNYTHDIYNVTFDLLLERYIYSTDNHKKGIILLESRGHAEDMTLLKHIDKIINKTGEKNIRSKELRKKIKGVYFNPKWNDDYKSTFIGLELTDLFSYPIYKFIKLGIKDKAFLTLENKIVGYPKYENKGIKVFPSQRKKPE